MTEFSIVVPIYRTEAYLKECIDSILSQTYTDFELILVDDGSPDRCPAMCDEYAQKDRRVQVIHQPNSGSVAARKTGIAHSTGKYVFTVDSDDCISSDCLALLHGAIERYDPDIVKLNFRRFSENSAYDYYNRFQDLYFSTENIDIVKDAFLYDKRKKGINFGCAAFGTWATVAKREWMASYQASVPNSITMGDDLAVTAPMMFHAESVYFMGGIQYYYRDTPGSIVNSFDEKAFERLEVLVRYLFQNVPERYFNSICVYTAELILETISKAAAYYTKKEYEDHVCTRLSDYLIHVAKKAKVHRLTLKDGMKLAMVKTKNYKLLYALMNRKG